MAIKLVFILTTYRFKQKGLMPFASTLCIREKITGV